MTHAILRVIEAIATIGVVSSAAYYLLCLWSAAKFRQGQARAILSGGAAKFNSSELPPVSIPVSILKPLKGTDPEMYESFRSHCEQDYSEYEIIFGVSDENDPAIENVQKLQREFPDRKIQFVVCSRILGANVKVSNLEQMLPHAQHEHCIVNDSDIRVERDYLRRVMAPLAEPQVGLVTCLYRGMASATLSSLLEALGISTEFCAGVLAAQSLEGKVRFGLGSTLAFRRADLQKIGGFISFVDYLADDYELGKRLAELGLEVKLSEVVVETFLPKYRLRDFIAHQLRWARGVRDARKGGYFGLILTFGIFWGLLTLAAGGGSLWSWGAFALVVALRFAVAIVVGWQILRDPQVLKYAWLIPLRDLIAVGVWIASFAGHKVTWRGKEFNLQDGKLSPMPQ